MRRSRHRLSAQRVLAATGPRRYHDGAGLYLKVTASQSKSWVFRYAKGDKRPEMGLGPFPAVSLAKARELAAQAETVVALGGDPIHERKQERVRRELELARRITFDQVACPQQRYQPES